MTTQLNQLTELSTTSDGDLLLIRESATGVDKKMQAQNLRAKATTKDDVGLGNVDNVSAADLRDRSTHTGTQTLSTISDAGTIASQDANSVNIDGGNIDGTAIGSSSASSGAFTTLTASDDVNFDSGTLFVDASANAVGIGTTSPSALLDVSSSGTPVAKIQSSALLGQDAKLVIRGSRTVSATGDFCQILFETNDEDAAGDSLGFITAGKDVSSTNQGLIRFGTTETDGGTPTEAMRINSSGNVGIGTTNPARKLHVEDVMRLEPRATAPSSPAKGDIYFDSSDDKLKCYDGSTWQNLY